MKKLVLKDGAPPVDQLRAILRVDTELKFDQAAWPDSPTTGPYVLGVRPTNIIESAAEEYALAQRGETDFIDYLEDSAVFEVVIVDKDNNIWSEYQIVPDPA